MYDLKWKKWKVKRKNNMKHEASCDLFEEEGVFYLFPLTVFSECGGFKTYILGDKDFLFYTESDEV